MNLHIATRATQLCVVTSAAIFLAACGSPEASSATPPTAAAGSASAHVASSATAAAPSAATTATSGSRELTNPDANTMVFLYYELAHLPLPVETMVEDDSRVKFAPAPDKAAHRAAVRAEIESAMASVHSVGSLRLTMNANLSDYDPSYGEFTVRALAPSSVVDFNALGQKVAINFTNGRTAQIWRVPQAESQAVRDKIGYAGNVEIDVLVRIANVLPGPGGGTISTEVVEYELRETQHGAVIARVQVIKP
jgi:hypothetical protein